MQNEPTEPVDKGDRENAQETTNFTRGRSRRLYKSISAVKIVVSKKGKKKSLIFETFLIKILYKILCTTEYKYYIPFCVPEYFSISDLFISLRGHYLPIYSKPDPHQQAVHSL